MSEHTLLFHIGIPKTGTSSLQAFFYENRMRLKNFGWHYPELTGREYLDGNGAAFFAKNDVDSGNLSSRKMISSSSREWGRIWSVIHEFLLSGNVLCSRETFWRNESLEYFFPLAKEEYENVKAIVYLRRQDLQIESFWNQTVKGFSNGMADFSEYIESCRDDGFGNLHYLKKLDKLSEILGKDNVIVRVYEKPCGASKDWLIRDFLTALNIDWDCESWMMPKTINKRLTGDYLEVKRIANSVFKAGFPVIHDLNYLITELSQDSSRGGMDTGYFALDERKVFLDQFSEENEQIARAYLHRENGILFYDDKMDFLKEEMHESSPFEQTMIRSFIALVSAQENRINKLEQRNRMMTLQRIEARCRNKELVLFGAGRRCIELLNMLPLAPMCIMDNDKNKADMQIKNIPVVYAGDFQRWPDVFILVTCEKTKDIEMQLQNLKLIKGDHYILAKEWLY